MAGEKGFGLQQEHLSDETNMKATIMSRVLICHLYVFAATLLTPMLNTLHPKPDRIVIQPARDICRC